MSRVYARLENSGERVLHRIECDAPGCNATIKPHSDIASSGWTKQGRRNGSDVGFVSVNDYCPEHAP